LRGIKFAICISNNHVQHDRTNHVEIDRLVKEKLDAGIIKITHVSSGQQVADYLTKDLGFLQRNWGLFRDEVVRDVQVFFSTGIMPQEVNDTAIVMIPKKNDPEELKDYKPIGLCNVVYKVVSKCLVNCLRHFL
jgi:hypothetical protein